MHPHTCLSTQIRSVLRKWYQKSMKHSVYTHFPKDRNCEVCMRTQMTRAPCRRRTGKALPRAEKFGDLVMAGHKVLIEEGESRNNHRYAVVVQDLATPWISTLSVQNKDFTGDGEKFLEPSHKPKVIYTDNPVEFGKSCEDLSWKHRTSTPIAERAVRRVKRRNFSRVLLQYQDWMKCGGLILCNAIAICEMSKTAWQNEKPLMKDGLENRSKDQQFLLEQWLNITRFQHESNQDFNNLARKFYQESFLCMH